MRTTNLLLICFGLVIALAGCKTTAEYYKYSNNGELEGMEKMVLKGTGMNKADFEKRTIENDSGFKVPEIRLPKMEFSD